MFDLIVHGGQIVSPDHTITGHVAIIGRQVAAIMLPGEESAALQARHVIDATGLYVIPGGIDPHVHLNLDYGPAHSQDYDDGTIAAAAGGTTTIINFAMQYGDETALDGAMRSVEQARGKAVIDFGLHVAFAGRFTPELIAGLKDLFAFGVPSVKIYMIYGTNPGWEGGDGGMWAVMQECREHNGMLMVHCENASIVNYLTREAMRQGKHEPGDVERTRPSFVEEEAMRRTFFLAEKASCPVYVVHMSIREGVDLIRSARGRHLPFYAETLATYLHWTDERTREADGGLFINFPPMRFEDDRRALWRAIADQDVSAVGTDDFAVMKADRDRIGSTLDSIPVGQSSIEARVGVLLQGVRKGWISMNDLVRVNSTNPARIFGLFPRKGIIAPGSDADLVLVDPNRKKRMTLADMHIGSDYTIWEGEEFTGFPVMTISKGRVVIDHDQFVGEKGWGEFLPRTVPDEVRQGRI
jgi:dihydropyrimidinase